MVPEVARVLAPTVVAGCGPFGCRVVERLREGLDGIDPGLTASGAYRFLRLRGAGPDPTEDHPSRVAAAAEKVSSVELIGTDYRLLGERSSEPPRPVRVFVVAGCGGAGSGEDARGGEEGTWCTGFIPALVAELAARVARRSLSSCHLLPVLAFTDRLAAHRDFQVVNRALHEARDLVRSRVFLLDTHTERSGTLTRDQVAQAATLFLEAALGGSVYGQTLHGRPETLPRLLAGEEVHGGDDPDENPVWCAVGVRAVTFPADRMVRDLAARGLEDFISSVLLRDQPPPRDPGAPDPRDQDFIQRLTRSLAERSQVGAPGTVSGAATGRRPGTPHRPWGPLTPVRVLKRSVAAWLDSWHTELMQGRTEALRNLSEEAARWRSTPTDRWNVLAATQVHLESVVAQEGLSLPQARRRLDNLRRSLTAAGPAPWTGLRTVVFPRPAEYGQKLQEARNEVAYLLERCPETVTMLVMAVPVGLVLGLAAASLLVGHPSSPAALALAFGLRIAAVPLAAGLLFWVWGDLRHGAVWRAAVRRTREFAAERRRLRTLVEDGLATVFEREEARLVRLVLARLDRAIESVRAHLEYFADRPPAPVRSAAGTEERGPAEAPEPEAGLVLAKVIEDPEAEAELHRTELPGGLALADKVGLAGREERALRTAARLLADKPPVFHENLRQAIAEHFRPLARRDHLRDGLWSRAAGYTEELWERLTVYLRPLGPDTGRTYAGTVDAVLAHPLYLSRLLERGLGADPETVAVPLPAFNRIYLLQLKYGIPFRCLGLGGGPSGEAS
ncbi:MAG: hypothetical protein K6U08_03730 [Firmicutes bacterium]|nr:hypothetical protein [Bacillota bacterium]